MTDPQYKEWTPGPYYVKEFMNGNEACYEILDSDDRSIGYIWGDNAVWLEKGWKGENARRIVACINACEGVATEVLESEDSEITVVRKQSNVS